MHPGDCPAWEYKHHPNSGHLRDRCHALLVALRGGGLPPRNLTHDTRPAHGKVFHGMTPVDCSYYAGHYRGEAYRCLQFHRVRIRGDLRVGIPPEFVWADLSILVNLIEQGFVALDQAFALPDAQLPRGEKVYYLVTFACRVFVEFLRIHPYVNGNGHMARLLIWAILGERGLWPKQWPLNDRPPDPPYSDLIKLHRDGNKEPLEKFVLKCVIG